MTALTARAPAKINLTLAVRGRRPDGYHELDSLVAFAGCHDTLTLDPARREGFSISGPTATQAGEGDGNLVMRAAGHLRQRVPDLKTGHFHLVKRLPVAAGIGGGSADAAAALRLLARLNGIPIDAPALHDAAAATGADVPVCLASRARRMGGIGHDLGPPLRLSLWAVLVNPRVGVATADVFKALGLRPGERRTGDGASPGCDPDAIMAGVNDLEPAAVALAPVIANVLAALAALPGCRIARMSGSGATCFALFDNCASAAAAAGSIRRHHAQWWVKPTLLR